MQIREKEFYNELFENAGIDICLDVSGPYGIDALRDLLSAFSEKERNTILLVSRKLDPNTLSRITWQSWVGILLRFFYKEGGTSFGWTNEEIKQFFVKFDKMNYFKAIVLAAWTMGYWEGHNLLKELLLSSEKVG